MASTPTTKSQVQAYRFVLRRMQSALVRRDAVMLHDPMRTHSRATAVGVILGVIGLIGFLVFGFFSPDPRLDDETQIAISKETGQVYVVRQGGTKQLIPMTNLASARLLILNQSNPDKAQQIGGGDAQAGQVNAAPQVAGGEPKLVSEKALAKLPKGRLTGIPDGPDVLPAKPEDRIGAEWSVCDTLDLDESLNNPTSKNKFETTVIAGMSGGSLLDGNKALLVKAGTDDKQAYLIYKAPVNSKITSTSTVRAKVDLTDPQVQNALNLKGKTVRAVSAGLLNAIPEAKPLEAPKITGAGENVTYLQGVPGLKVGHVIEVERTGADSEFYVALKDGLQKISRAAGDLIRADNEQGAPKVVNIAKIDTKEPAEKLDFLDYPAEVPDVLEPNQNNRVVCLGWRAENVNADNRSQHTQVTIAPSLPVPTDAVAVNINQVGATGEAVSKFIMAPGKSAVVRAATSTQDFRSGPIHLITGRGVKYGIPDTLIAGALGLGDQFVPGPESILRLLPNGPQLNRNDAIRSWDSIPVPKNVGLLPEEQAKKASGG
ncbi:type VII secretion protein EccB [Saccharothrix sp. NPDC042600]|uniref:type VII secretion protein EccB n=1 Tax=Saccharothrix TaxID=2071 RepID=UPI0033D0D841|nr:type VII secretion protein EccB [Saccharothrix mutabilis subsp. capreolus]